MTDLHPDPDLLIDLALSDIDQEQRDEVVSHLALCDPCRRDYADIADGVDHALAAAPWVAPPPGFSRSVLAAMGMTSTDAQGAPVAGLTSAPTPPSPSSPARPHELHSRRVLVSVMAAVLALLAGVAVGAAVMDARQAPPGAVAAVGPALLTRDGSRVGTVLDTWYDGQPVLAVTLTAGKVGVRYDCQLILADGSRQPAGSWVLHEPSGTTWLLDRPEAKVTGLELVADSGRTWATAEL